MSASGLARPVWLGRSRPRSTTRALSIVVAAALLGSALCLLTDHSLAHAAVIALLCTSLLAIAVFAPVRDPESRDVTEDDFFHRVAEGSAGGILYLDAAAKVTFANSRWREMAGAAPCDLDGEDWLAWIDPRDHQLAGSLWVRSRSLHVPSSADLRYIHPVDGPGWVELSFHPVLRDGLVLGFVARISDVSVRRHAERALKTSEGLYRLLAENSQDMVMRLDRAGCPRYVSSAAWRLLGYQPAELVGRPLAAFIHHEDQDAFEALLPLRNGECGDVTAQFRMHRKRGDFIWVETNARLIVDRDSGDAGELVASMRNIHDRRRTEDIAADAAAKLRETNRLLTLAENLALIGHWRFDATSGSFDYSPQISVMTGLPRDITAEPADVLARVHADDRKLLLRALAKGRLHRTAVECRARLQLGGDVVRHVRLVVHAERSVAGGVTGMFGVVRDFTDEQAIYAELIRARDAAEAAARAKGNFLATMSHEIRTPMTGVLGMIDLLRSDPSNEDRDRYFATLKQSADLLMAVLDDVLDFSRIDSGKISFEERDFDLIELMQSTFDLFDGAASGKGLLLALDAAPGLQPTVRGDPVRLQQVVSNLLSNAIKFTDTGRITISLSAEPVPGASNPTDRQWRIEVRDTGIGVAPEQMSRLFEPFIQAEAAISRRFGGTGLGLAISRRLVDAMGGRMGVVSNAGDGSTFWFELRLPAGTAPAVAALPAQPGGSRSLDLLVAEDNPVNQMIIGALLRRFGHTATCVENGRLAVEAAATCRFDCILMDMQMPEMDGLAATRAIRASGGINAEVPIIALTADASLERRRFYDNAGLTDFLTKPIDRAALGERLATVMDEIDARTPRAPVHAEPPRPTPALFDTARYHELREVLGNPQVDALLDLLMTELGERPRRIRELFGQGDIDGVRAEAHSLRGAAGNVGAMALGQIAAAIEAASDEQALGRELEALDRQADRTVKAIAALR